MFTSQDNTPVDDIGTTTFHSRILARCDRLIGQAHAQLTKDRVDGILYGIMLGDALGLPVETFTRTQIAERFGRVKDFLDPKMNTFMREQDNPVTACTSDDLQLTLAGLEATLSFPSDGSFFDMTPVVRYFIEALEESDLGWGGSTRNAAVALKEGIPWRELIQRDDWQGYTGNGIPMKIAGFALHAAATEMTAETLIEGIENVALLSHRSSDGISSGLTQTFALLYCLGSTPETFSKEEFLETIIDLSTFGETFLPERQGEYTLASRIRLLSDPDNWNVERCEQLFNGGTSEVRDSLPFTYAYFLKNPTEYETLIDLVNAGGDTDSTAAMAGSLIGAISGKNIFPEELLMRIPTKDGVGQIVRRFSDIHKLR